MFLLCNKRVMVINVHNSSLSLYARCTIVHFRTHAGYRYYLSEPDVLNPGHVQWIVLCISGDRHSLRFFHGSFICILVVWSWRQLSCVKQTFDIIVLVHRLAIFGIAGTAACPGLNRVVFGVYVDPSNLRHEMIVAWAINSTLAIEVIFLHDVGSVCLDETRFAVWTLFVWLIPSRISHRVACVFTVEFRMKLDHSLVEYVGRFDNDGRHDCRSLLMSLSKGFWILRIQFYVRNGNDTIIYFSFVEISSERVALRSTATYFLRLLIVGKKFFPDL